MLPGRTTSKKSTRICKENAARSDVQLIEPAWPLPHGVKAVVSTRLDGVSEGVYASANLGDHVGDVPAHVAANRHRLAEQTGVQKWQWLQQVHGVEVFEAGNVVVSPPIADGVITTQEGIACAVLTADCLPLLMCAEDGSQVAAVHAGWRGLAAGIIARGIDRFACSPAQLSVYLGPAIGPKHFEVGEDVLLAFRPWGIPPLLWSTLFVSLTHKPGHYLADLYGLARWSLQQHGVTQVFGGDACTYGDSQRFYSYRRDGATGRMVSAIWRVGPSN
jgi:polyphenol oxidase